MTGTARAGGQLPSAGEVSDTLQAILADPEFTTLEAQDPLWTVILRELREAIARLWRWLIDLFGNEGGIWPALLAVAVALAALAAIVAVARRHVPRLRMRKEAAAAPQAVAPRTAAEWILQARRRAGQGELRPAATDLYRGFLLSQEARGALVFHDSKTPGDYALEIARNARDGTGQRFLRAFEDFSFGQEEPTVARWGDLERVAHAAGCPVEAVSADQAEEER